MIHPPASAIDRRRRFIRTAASILKTLASERRASPIVQLPLESWALCTDLTRLLNDVQVRGWNAAAAHVRQHLTQTLETFMTALRATVRDHHRLNIDAAPPSLRFVMDDLTALETEFDEVEVDLQKKQLSVTTDSIELEGVSLGQFKIRLNWSRLGENRPYEVEADEPNPAAGDSSVTHPHVHGNALCEGDGKFAIRSALEAGRLLDFFLLVRQILETYNPSSAYVRLKDWEGVSCVDCGCTSDRDESSSCERCESDLCGDCVSSCSDCGRSSCSECRSVCHGCDSDFCRRCLNDCDTCGDAFCGECLTDGQCDNCRETSEEPDETLEPEVTETTAPATTDAEVHADGMGEVGVPA